MVLVFCFFFNNASFCHLVLSQKSMLDEIHQPSSLHLSGGLTCPFCRHFSGAEDVVMAFSRSETEDRRQWPSAPPPSHSTPLHPTPPPSHPARDPQQPKLHNHVTDELRRGGAPGRDGRGGEETPGGGCLALPQPFPHPPTPPRTSWHTITWDALKCFTVGWSLGNKAVSENTHRLCGWISNVVFFFSFWWVLYYFVCVETLGSVTCYICCGRWRNWPVSSWLKQREI